MWWEWTGRNLRDCPVCGRRNTIDVGGWEIVPLCDCVLSDVERRDFIDEWIGESYAPSPVMAQGSMA